ncbi:MAG: signal peptidase II, partial [Candidatus Margulisiibacteriota bacterium]
MFYFLLAIFVALDQGLKYWASHNFLAPKLVIPNVFALAYIKNTGAAFGIFPESTWLFISISLIVIVVILVWQE